MLENNHIEDSDFLLKSILENGQEEVPEHIWEGVAEGLDRAARRRTAVLWFGRAAAVAAAAAIAVGVFFRHDDNAIVPAAEGDMIAVVENASENKMQDVLLAEQTITYPADKPVFKNVTSEPVMETVMEPVVETTAEMAQKEYLEKQETAEVTIAEEQKAETEEVPAALSAITDDMDWEEEAKPKKKVRASVVISGIAGSNSPQNNRGIGPFRSPSALQAPIKTSIEPTSAQTTYGIPLSAGAGIKLHFTPRWSLGLGLNYTLLTSKFSGKYIKVEDGIALTPITANVHNSLHYIGIPINAYYNIVSRDFINFYTYAGGTVEKCLANIYQVQTTPVIHHEEAVNGVQLSTNVGIGVEFLLGRHVGLYIDPSLRYYFQGCQPKSIRTAQPLMFGFEMGFRFNL